MEHLDDFEHAPKNFDAIDPMYDEDSGMCNRWRAKRVSVGLRAYWGGQGHEEAETIAKDFLTDLLHWGDGHGLDIEELLARARWMYQEEMHDTL